MKINCCTYGNSRNDSSKLGHVLQDTTKLFCFFREGVGNHELQTTWCFYRSQSQYHVLIFKIKFYNPLRLSNNSVKISYFRISFLVNTLWSSESVHIDYSVFFIDTFFPRWSHLLTTKNSYIIPDQRREIFYRLFLWEEDFAGLSVSIMLERSNIPASRVIKSYNIDKLENTESLKTKPKPCRNS